jgi:hypothetical protein
MQKFPTVQEVIGRRKALIIGVSEYENNDLKPLPFCKQDADKMFDLLKSQGYLIPNDRNLIGEVKAHQMKDAIYDFFTEENIKSQDLLLFYYSGHGIPDVDDDVFLASSEINPIQPFRKGFLFSELTKMMNRSISTKIVAILDCCYSGAAKVSKGSEDDAASLGAFAIDKKSKLLQQGEGKCLLAASQSYQEAYGKKKENHSVFTYYLLEGLKENELSVDIYGNVTVDTLGIYVYNSITSLSEQKGPKQKPIRKVEAGGNIVLIQYPQLAKSEDNLLKLLKEGKVTEFNTITRSYQIQDDKRTRDFECRPWKRKSNYRLNFGGKDISNVNLARVDLHEADICRTLLFDSDFTDSIFEGANLASARAEGAIFLRANLQYTYLHKIDLSRANLLGANLSRAILQRASLVRTVLSEADLSHSVVVGCT